MPSTASAVSMPSDFDEFLAGECHGDDDWNCNDATTSTQMSEFEPMTAGSAPTPSTPSVLSSETSRQTRKRSGETSVDHSEILQELLNRKPPNPIDFLPPKPPAPKDGLHHFFESIESAMRTFSPLAIARIKLQISNIVGEEEIACTERSASVEVV